VEAAQNNEKDATEYNRRDESEAEVHKRERQKVDQRTAEGREENRCRQRCRKKPRDGEDELSHGGGA
jgi:hypothetical protein